MCKVVVDFCIMKLFLLIFQAMEEGARPANAAVGEVGGTDVEF